MALFTYILLLHFLNYTLAKNCVNENVPDYITWGKEFLKDLKCGYNPYYAPNENTVLNITYAVEAFHFDSEAGLMTIQTFMHTKWKDGRLKWDPEKHHGIKEIDASDLHIWTPIFGLINAEDYYLFSEMFVLYRYNLRSYGVVQGSHRMVQDTMCNVKLTDWPYDVQECSYDFGPMDPIWTKANYSINFRYGVKQRVGAEWYIYDYKHVRDKRNVKVTFYLMREAEGLAAIVIYPALILTVLSILPLCLDVKCQVRLSISCFSLSCNQCFLMEIGYNIPTQCNYPPTLLLYYRGSVILNILIILLTFVLIEVCKWKSSPHNYIKTINDYVYDNNYRSYFVFPRWDCDDAADDSKSNKDDWLKFANFVNSVFIFVIVFTYIGLYAAYIPKRTQHDNKIEYFIEYL